MSKAAIIVEMPQSCHECRFWFSKATEPVKYRCMAAQKYIENLGGKPDWRPLKKLPKKIGGVMVGEYTIGRADGWNACLDTITGQQDEET